VKIFLDTGDMEEINKWKTMGVIDGLTTNPTILKKQHSDLSLFAQLLSPMPVSLEVTTDDLDLMIEQGKKLFEYSPNVRVKIPVQNSLGQITYLVIKQLEQNYNVRVNATAVMSFGQVMLAAKAGATYISIFWGRIGNEGGNAQKVVCDSVDWLKYWNYKSEIIVGSIHTVDDVLQVANCKAHIITIPPNILTQVVENEGTKKVVKQFIEDSKK